MKNLRTLRLMHTKITDTTVQSLAALQQLESLSLFDTQVTPACLPVLAKMPRLKRVYVGNTKISSGPAIPQELAQKLMF
jgi:Leucine-rich repeat (LRR) protein